MSQNSLLDVSNNELEIIEFLIDEKQPDGKVYSGHYGINVAKVLEIIRLPNITSVPSKCDPSVLGTFNLRGKVLPIGGVKEKVLAAHRAGVTNILLPKDNEKDLADIPEVRVIERYIAQPDCGETGFVHTLSHLRVILQGRAWTVRVAFQWGNKTEGQIPLFEYAGITRVLLKVRGDCACARLRGHRGTLVVADGGDVEGEMCAIKSRWRGL